MHQAEALVVHGNPTPSHVLIAIGNKEDELNGALRVTFGYENTKEDVDYLIKCLIQTVNEDS